MIKIDSQSRSIEKWLMVAFLLIIWLFSLTQDVSAQTIVPPTPSVDDVNAVAKQLYCPVCENTPLDVCSTQACEQWRDLIAQKLQDGWSEDQIKDYFVDQYGDHVLAEPPRSGFNLFVYILPLASILFAFMILVFGVRSMRKPQTSSENADLSDENVESMNRYYDEDAFVENDLDKEE